MTDKKLLYQQYPDVALYAEKVSDKAAPADLFKNGIPSVKNPFKVCYFLDLLNLKSGHFELSLCFIIFEP